LELSSIRRIHQIAFFLLFLVLIVANTSGMDGLGIQNNTPVRLFLELSPLNALSSLLSTGILYKGLILALITVAFTLFFGRLFCGWVCPFGALHQFVSWLFFPKKGGCDLPARNAHRKIYSVKYYLLFALLLTALMGLNLSGFFDPIALTYRSLTLAFTPILLNQYIPAQFSFGWVFGVLFIGFLLLNLIYPRFWCRVLCPLGALLGTLAFAPLFKIQRDEKKCTNCNLCALWCQGGDEPQGMHRVRECHVCLNCTSSCNDGAITYRLLGELGEGRKLDLDRRKLVITLSASAFLPLVVRASSGRTKAASPGCIRPPGALDEQQFVRTCIKCGSCMKTCPTNALHPAFAEASFEGFWTPVMISRIGWCTQNCNLCGKACPTGAIRRFTIEEKIGLPIRQGSAVIDPGRCLPFAYGRPCIVCEEMCPTSPKAVFFEEVEVEFRGTKRLLKRPRVDLRYCTGCGICENKCPVGSQPAIYMIPSGETRNKRDRFLLE
jgi:MauM/NapG family ferredoxin protein